jgi:N-acetylglutamate synthase-like GNAT family acetyltransferase
MMKTLASADMQMHDYRIRSAVQADLPFIQDMVARLRLDNEDLRPEQFIVVEEGERTVAFGRIKPYRRTFELGCVAVVEDRRGQGIGELVVRELIRRFPQRRVFVTTDIPEYFERLGFVRTTALPRELSEKIRRVEGKLRSGVVGMVYRIQGQTGSQEGGVHDD